MRIFLSLILLLSLVNCTPPNTTSLSDYEYFDVEGFASNLLIDQYRAGKTVLKTVSINGEEETNKIVHPDSSFWAIELAGLLAIDLNKPSLIDAYNIENGGQDEDSNLLVDTYIAKNPLSVQVQKIKIFYWLDKQEVRKIEFNTSSVNILLKEEIDFVLWVNRYSGVLLIDSVETNVYSQQFGKKVNHYKISTVID